jgi:uncharacterized membrane protein YeaQ/YmgE (transglycosylase-associated protein family)
LTLPSLLLGLLISSLYGALFHLLRGGDLTRLISYLFLAWIGFALGHFIGNWFHWILYPIGPLNFGTATIGSIVLLALSLAKMKRAQDKDDAV